MSIKEPTLRRTEETRPHRMEETQPPARKPVPGFPRKIGSAVAIVVLLAAGIAYSLQRGEAVEPADLAVDEDAILQDLVNKGLIPRQALEEPSEPADLAVDEDAILQDLVNKGLIPRQALE